MFSFLKNIFTTTPTEDYMGYIIETSNGRFALTDRNGRTIQTYSRARDARRGAQRRGLAAA